MAKINVPEDFKEFLRLLDFHRVEYLLVGGYSVAFHGYPRSTADMDIWISTEGENPDRIVGALREFGFDLPELTRELFTHKDRIIRMGSPPLRLEIFTHLSGVEFTECYPQRVTETIDGVKVRIIDLGNLRKNKAATGRFKDLDDLQNLPESPIAD